MELYRLNDAAKLMSVSFPTLKQWIYQGKLKSVKTPGGHHRIPRSEVDRLSGLSTKQSTKSKQPAALSAISGRNKLLGTVTAIRYEGLLAQVTIEVSGQSITSIITRDACEDLKLRKGSKAYALIKATEVMVIRG
ncbi:MAG TPA: TOBE domain-containing protein [Blastocatellia bacterium]|nr:TOBE domain-containing protein [Blastocatellia bacterium]